MLDIATIKYAATGRWRELISRICGLDVQYLDGFHHPCPRCGGVDRFRMIDADQGAVYCNQCFNRDNGDGIATVMWLTGLSFTEAAGRIADELGMASERVEQDIVLEMAWRKGITVDSLVAYGATPAVRDDITVCRVPMHDADMQVVGHLDLAPWPAEMSKGKMTRGSSHGLFVAVPPQAGETVMVVEGVKDAAALHNLGMLAVGLPTCRMDASFARLFRGCHVVVIPDRDQAGMAGAQETAGRLYGVAATVKVAELPAEYRETGGADVRDILRMRDGKEKLLQAIKHARPWKAAGVKSGIQFTLLSDAVERLLNEDEAGQELLRTGLPEVDDALSGGVARGEMVIIAGRPSHGKTTVGLQALDSLSEKVPVLIVSEEMGSRALAERVTAGITDVALRDVGFRREKALADAGRHFAARHPFFIIESCGTVEKTIEAIAKAKEEHQIGAAAIDYVQLLRGKGNSRYEQVSDVSTQLKQCAVRYDIVLLAVCQMNRATEDRKDTGPRMSDLRDSGQLEQDADVILFVEWLSRSRPDRHDKAEYMIYIAKNRNRGTKRDRVTCVFKPERQRLYPIERRQQVPSRYAEFEDYE